MKPKDYSIEEVFDQLFQILPQYIDYYESDLGNFLNIKLSKNYFLYKFFWIFSLLIYMTTTLLYFLLDLTSPNITFGIISFISLIVFYYLDKLIYKKYKYSNFFFQGKKKKLLIFKNKIKLLLNNTYLSEKNIVVTYDKIKIKANQVLNRIDANFGIIQSNLYFLKKYSLLSILITPFVSFLINLIYNAFQGSILFNIDTLYLFVLNLLIILFLFLIAIQFFRNLKKSRKFKEIRIYMIHERIIFMLLDFISSKLRNIQFPDEKKLEFDLYKSYADLLDSPEFGFNRK